jgi:hypothetical protein
MKNGIDFVYEYSDLNLFHTRVQILIGEYAGIVLEYGGSGIAQWEDKNLFNFDYILYEVPDKFYGPTLRKSPEFNEYLAYLLVDVISTRNNDPKEKEKLEEAASFEFMPKAKIKISDKWYGNNNNKKTIQQPKTSLENF